MPTRKPSISPSADGWIRPPIPPGGTINDSMPFRVIKQIQSDGSIKYAILVLDGSMEVELAPQVFAGT